MTDLSPPTPPTEGPMPRRSDRELDRLLQQDVLSVQDKEEAFEGIMAQLPAASGRRATPLLRWLLPAFAVPAAAAAGLWLYVSNASTPPPNAATEEFRAKGIEAVSSVSIRCGDTRATASARPREWPGSPQASLRCAEGQLPALLLVPGRGQPIFTGVARRPGEDRWWRVDIGPAQRDQPLPPEGQAFGLRAPLIEAGEIRGEWDLLLIWSHVPLADDLVDRLLQQSARHTLAVEGELSFSWIRLAAESAAIEDER